jgi:hypothetical protein
MMSMASLIATGATVRLDGAEPDKIQKIHDRAAVWRGLEKAVAEVRLLLLHQQLEALETEATRQEMTVGQLLRRLIRNGLAGLGDASVLEEPVVPSSCASHGSLPNRNY